MRTILTLALLFIISTMTAQDDTNEHLPFAKIPDYPETYNAGTVVARMVDGLGFRYYWATEGLTKENLAYKPSETNRTIEETIDHIYGLSTVIRNSATKTVNDRTNAEPDTLGFEAKRKKTLKNLWEARTIFITATDLTGYQLVFKGKNGTREFPFWNQINGPIEDAVWHTGQVVALRRAAGNPFDSRVSVFNGIRREE